MRVKFIPGSENAFNVLEEPKPAKKYYPDWLKKIPNIDPIENKVDSPKLCTPFIDTFVSGYIQELCCDLIIGNDGKDDNGKDLISYRWFGPVKPVSSRIEEYDRESMFPKFDGFYNSEQHWNTFWEPETPKGYSTLYVHPLNRNDLPFVTLSGIIDTDKFSVSGPLPFLIKEGFVGLIPAGTPIYQIFFIKRDTWKSSKEVFDKKKNDKQSFSVKRFARNGYKRMFWERKQYL